MEILTKKCDFIRKKSFGLEKYVENNTIYVVLGPKDSKNNTSIGELLITMINKIRISAGLTPKYKVPNLILVQEIPKGADKIGNFVEWNHKVLGKKTSLKKEHLEKYLCSDGISVINPFIAVGDGVLMNNYGPCQEFMSFEVDRHERRHYAMQKAIKAILELGSLKFSDFQLLIHAVIFSQYCDQCLFCLLEPLDSLEKAQKIVNTISHGIWCPLDRNSMDRVTWKTDDGKVYEPTCWRMDENAKVICPSKPTTSSSPSEPKPLQKQPSLADWQINSLHRVLDILQENSDKLDEVTNYEQQDSVAAEKRKLNTIRMNLNRWLMDLNEFETNAQVVVGKFGFKTGNSELDKVLEEKILELFKNRKLEINFLKILNCIGHKAYGIYKKVEKGKKIENHVMEKIAEKSRYLLEKTQNSKNLSKKKRNEEEESDGEAVDDEESGDDVEDEENCGDEEEEDSEDVEGRVDEEEEQEKNDGGEEQIEENQSPEPIEMDHEEDAVKIVDKIRCPRSDQMTLAEKECLWAAFKTGYDCMKDLRNRLPITRHHRRHVFCIYCREFVDDLGPRCFSHDESEGRVKIELLDTFDWKTVDCVDKEDCETIIQFLKKQGKYWKIEISQHNKNPAPVPPPAPPAMKTEKDRRMARRTGVPIRVEQQQKPEPVQEENMTRKRKNRAFVESSGEDSDRSKKQVERSERASKRAKKRSEESGESDASTEQRLKTLRSYRSDGKKTTERAGKSAKVSEEWGQDSDEQEEDEEEEVQVENQERPSKKDSAESSRKKAKQSGLEGSEGSEDEVEDWIDRVAEDLRRRGIKQRDSRQSLPERTPKKPQPDEPGEFEDFTEFNTVINRKQLRKAATVGFEIVRIDHASERSSFVPGSRQDFWRRAQQFEVIQKGQGPSEADISRMDTPSGSEHEMEMDDDEEENQKKKKTSEAEKKSSGGKKTTTILEPEKSNSMKSNAVKEEQDTDEIQILDVPPKDPIRTPTVNWDFAKGRRSSSMDQKPTHLLSTSSNRSVNNIIFNNNDESSDSFNSTVTPIRQTTSSEGTNDKKENEGKKSFLKKSDANAEKPAPSLPVFDFNPSKISCQTQKSPAKSTKKPVIIKPVITLNREIFQDNEIVIRPSSSISNEVIMENLNSSATPTTVDNAVIVISEESLEQDVEEVDFDGVANEISEAEERLVQEAFDYDQHLSNIQNDHDYCSPAPSPPNNKSIPDGFRFISTLFITPETTPKGQAKLTESSSTATQSASILNGSQNSSIKFQDMDEDTSNDCPSTPSLPAPTPPPISSAQGTRNLTEKPGKQIERVNRNDSPAQQATTSIFDEEKVQGGNENDTLFPPGKTTHAAAAEPNCNVQ